MFILGIFISVSKWMIQHKVLYSRSTSTHHGFVDFIKDVNDKRTCYNFLFTNIMTSNIHKVYTSPPPWKSNTTTVIFLQSWNGIFYIEYMVIFSSHAVTMIKIYCVHTTANNTLPSEI